MSNWAEDTALVDPVVITQPEAAPSAALEPGARLGRYVLLDRIGAGGMGVVYAAYDPQLDRKIALKLLRPSHGVAHDSAGPRARLLREAQAMARLSHPNVVAVHDVGTFGGEVFVAMEFVDGGTLRQWLTAAPRTQREILEVYARAGSGLAAAHAAGLIHRDFKPDNVLIGRDGRVRVLDFGLARRHGEEEASTAAPGDVGLISDGGLLATPLTRTGALMGTPAYMAPEQHVGASTDARTDQYSFCVALYEALYGKRPFEASTHDGLRREVMSGHLAEAPRDSRVPERIRKALVRGLSLEPRARYPSMNALLHDLGQDPAARRKRAMTLAGVGVAAVALAIGVPLALRTAPPPPCEGSAAAVDDVWGPRQQASLRTAFLATGAASAAEAATLTARALDRWRAAWIAMRREACEATHVRHEQSDSLLDLRMACLSQRRGEMRALVEVFAKADAKLTRRGVDAVSALSDLAGCADGAALAARVKPPTDTTLRAQVERARDELARVRAQRAAGQYAPALERAEKLHADAASLPYRPLHAAVAQERGGLLARRGKLPLAEDALQAGFVAALAGGDDERAARLALRLGTLVGDDRGRAADGGRWLDVAGGFIERLGGAPQLRATLEANRGVLAGAAGQYAQAEAFDKRAVELSQRVLGLDDPLLAMRHLNWGVTLFRLGRLDEAVKRYRQALELSERVLGRDHPRVAVILNNLGVVENDRGNHRAAITHHERALALRERAFGGDHPAVADSHNNLGGAYKELLDLPRAHDHFVRALAIYEKKQGPAHRNVAMMHNNIGSLLEVWRRPNDALPHLLRALEIWRGKKSPARIEAAFALQNIGWARRRLGEREAASASFREAVVMREAALGGAHPDLAEPLIGLGKVALDGGQTSEAQSHLSRAIALLEKSGTEPVLLAQARFALARSLATSPNKRGRTLATQAREALSGAGPARRSEVERIDRWLRGAPAVAAPTTDAPKTNGAQQKPRAESAPK